MSKHAILAPSSAKRWLACTPSAILESTKPNTYSVYAQEGTDAHSLAELKLSYALGYIDDDLYQTKFDDFRLTTQFYNQEFNEFVNDYVKEVMAIIKEDYQNEEIQVYLEQRLKFEDIVPGGSGTGDVVIVGKNFVHIIDLKFGKGVAVSAIGNPQLRLYALGAIRRYLRICDCREVRMTIIQPRLYDISTDYMSIFELNDWAINYVKPRADLAIAGKGELVPGEHCKFCKCSAECKVLGEKQLEAARKEFEDAVESNTIEPNEMSKEMLSKILEIGPKFVEWFNDVYSHATKMMIQEGLEIPGFKIVMGRSTRQIMNTEMVIEKLKTAGFAEEDYLTVPKLQGITNLEKNVGKKLFNNLCGEYVIKPTGKLTVVPESDKRTAISSQQIRLEGQEFDITDE